MEKPEQNFGLTQYFEGTGKSTKTFRMCCCAVLSLSSRVWLFVIPWTVARQAPLSMGILQARTLEWVARPSSRRSSWPRDQTQASRIAGGFFTFWATREACAGWTGGQIIAAVDEAHTALEDSFNYLVGLNNRLNSGPERPCHLFRILPVQVPGPPDLPMFRAYSRQRPTCPELNHLSEVHLHLLAPQVCLPPAGPGVTSCLDKQCPHPIPSHHPTEMGQITVGTQRKPPYAGSFPRHWMSFPTKKMWTLQGIQETWVAC